MIRQSIIAAMVFLAPVGTGAQPVAAPKSHAAAAPDPEERICKDVDVTGIKFEVRRVCATRAQWQEREQIDKDAVRQMQRPIQTCMIMGTRRC